MNLETINKYEENGIKVTILDHPDPHFRTRTFVTLPNGLEYPHYDVFYEIPHLNDNDNFVLASTAVHPEDRRDNDTIIWTDVGPNAGQSEMVLTWIALATLIIEVVGAILIFVCVYYILNLLFDPHPCGTTGAEIPINDCYKKIIFPDCHWKWFNSCGGPDNNGDGKPDGIVEDEGGGDDMGDKIMKLIIVGAVAVGGVLVLTQFLKKPKEKKYEK